MGKKDRPAGAQTIVLGRRYRDSITGFEGTAVIRSEHINGCIQISLSQTGTDDKGNLKPSYAFDEARLIDIEADELVSSAAPRGGPVTDQPDVH